MGVLDRITGPRDLRDLTDAELDDLAAEIRDFLVRKVSRTGGHLGPNLGVVELTLALHRVFDSPQDRIVFDTGHQSYVHKIVTGRAAGFDQLRQEGGLSGYPSQAVGVGQRGGRVGVLDDVVGRLGLARVAGQATLLAKRVEAARPAGEHLVHVRLVTGVEQDPVVR